MHHDASRDVAPTFIIKAHAKDKHGGQPRPCFAGFSWNQVRQGSMETQSKAIKGASSMQARVWMRAFGQCSPMEHAITKAKKEHGVHWRKTEPRGPVKAPGRP
jgi:hypothetical protein